MNVLCYGSLNIDYVYTVPHFVCEGETLGAISRDIFPGGKGLNQSIALSKAGLRVSHAGALGVDDGEILKSTLEQTGINTEHISQVSIPTGHAIIQRTLEGKNCILVSGGANQAITRSQIDQVLKDFSEGDYLVLQNEISSLPYLVDKGHGMGLKVIFNPSPINDQVFTVDLSKVDIFLINEVEAQALIAQYNLLSDFNWAAIAQESQLVLRELQSIYPHALFVLTMGGSGSAAIYQDEFASCKAFKAAVCDTTAAGDCFTGYFLAAYSEQRDLKDCLEIASAAASIAVSRPGAAPSIPWRKEVDNIIWG